MSVRCGCGGDHEPWQHDGIMQRMTFTDWTSGEPVEKEWAMDDETFVTGMRKAMRRSMTDPTTEAGRRLYARPEVFAAFLSDILAIEAEARDDALAEGTDPALREAATTVLEAYDLTGWPDQEVMENLRAALAATEAAPPPNDTEFDWHQRGWKEGYAAAAEAAPLDVERLTVALWGMDFAKPDAADLARRIAREYAALRSPDTETAE